ncbi:hypothetical protein GCM10018783_34430 [Streptomyces griseosporeus]|nr:hypothetical protein GCM10018783_34430 [Streptomyces griseosporeus]
MSAARAGRADESAASRAATAVRARRARGSRRGEPGLCTGMTCLRKRWWGTLVDVLHGAHGDTGVGMPFTFLVKKLRT